MVDIERDERHLSCVPVATPDHMVNKATDSRSEALSIERRITLNYMKPWEVPTQLPASLTGGWNRGVDQQLDSCSIAPRLGVGLYWGRSNVRVTTCKVTGAGSGGDGIRHCPNRATVCLLRRQPEQNRRFGTQLATRVRLERSAGADCQFSDGPTLCRRKCNLTGCRQIAVPRWCRGRPPSPLNRYLASGDTNVESRPSWRPKARHDGEVGRVAPEATRSFPGARYHTATPSGVCSANAAVMSALV
jgi:hypothetical protein